MRAAIIRSRRFGSGETAVLRETSRSQKVHGENNGKNVYAKSRWPLSRRGKVSQRRYPEMDKQEGNE